MSQTRSYKPGWSVTVAPVLRRAPSTIRGRTMTSGLGGRAAPFSALPHEPSASAATTTRTSGLLATSEKAVASALGGGGLLGRGPLRHRLLGRGLLGRGPLRGRGLLGRSGLGRGELGRLD